jgi:hypothetical protein
VVYFVFHGINGSNGLSLPTVHRKSLPFTVSTLPDSGFSIIHNVTHKISLSGFISFYLKMNENTHFLFVMFIHFILKDRFCHKS